MTSYQYRKSHCGDKTILRPSYLHNGISYTDKTTSLYWIRALVPRDVIYHPRMWFHVWLLSIWIFVIRHHIEHGHGYITGFSITLLEIIPQVLWCEIDGCQAKKSHHHFYYWSNRKKASSSSLNIFILLNCKISLYIVVNFLLNT